MTEISGVPAYIPYQFVIQVQANDKLYDITATRFKGKSVYAKIPMVMQLVTDAVRYTGRTNVR